MRKQDDSSLSADQAARVKKEAKRVLVEAGVIGILPTPVEQVMLAARLQEVEEDVLNEDFVARMRHKAGDALKRALSKVLGLFDARSRLVFIDRGIHVVKQTFIRLHETAHGFMPWQSALYAVVEDCEKTLSPDVADLFDREANVFAAEVMFQLDAFSEEAEAHEFGILTPIKLSSKYGASIYAAVRRYVARNSKACCVLVLDPPTIVQGEGFRANLRRSESSSRFSSLFGNVSWPEYFTPSDKVGKMVPLGKRRMSGRREITLCDQNGQQHLCVAEAFTQTYQVFVLIHAIRTLSATTVLFPPAA